MALQKASWSTNRWTLRLIAPPGLGEIHQFLSQALENPGQQISVSWTIGVRDYKLMVLCRPQGGEAQWQLSGGNRTNMVLLWTHSSCDVILIHNLIGLSCSEEEHPAVPAEGALAMRDANPFGANNGKLFCDLRGAGEPDGAKDQTSSSGNLLAGELASFNMFNLLQHVARNQMTGCISLRNQCGERAEIHVIQGSPIHAGCSDLTGDDCILELLTWKEGTFAFAPNKVTTSRTVNHTVETLLLSGMRMVDILAQLDRFGFSKDTVLFKQRNLTEEEFEQTIIEKYKSDMNMQKKVFLACDGRRTAGQIFNGLRMPCRVWAPIVLNLMASRLLALKNPCAGRQLTPKRIDQSIVHEIWASLRHTNTGLYTYAAFLYFLEQEYFRACRTGSPMCVMLFEIKMQDVGGGEHDLTQEQTVELLSWINKVKRHTDVFAEYEGNSFALLLPETSTGGAKVFASRLVNGLLRQANDAGKKLVVHAGLALADKQSRSLGLLLAAAEAARDFAKMTNAGLVDFNNIVSAEKSAEVLSPMRGPIPVVRAS